MGMTIEDCISKVTEILEEVTEDENAVCYVTDVDESTLKTAIDTMRKYQKIESKIKVLRHFTEDTPLATQRMIRIVNEIREVLEDGNDD